MNDLSTIPVMVDEQYNSALQFGEYFTQLYLLGPHCLRPCLDKISQADDPEMAIQAWMKGYTDYRDGNAHAFPTSHESLPFVSNYNSGYSHSYVFGEQMSAAEEAQSG